MLYRLGRDAEKFASSTGTMRGLEIAGLARPERGRFRGFPLPWTAFAILLETSARLASVDG